MINYRQFLVPPKIDPETKWPNPFHALELAPLFERTMKFKLSDITPDDLFAEMSGDRSKGILPRTMKQLGFTYTWDELFLQVETWKDNDCYYSSLSPKAKRFFTQLEGYALWYFDDDPNKGEAPIVNTWIEKFSFHKAIESYTT